MLQQWVWSETKRVQSDRTLSEKGDVKAQHNLVMFYENGRFVVKNRFKLLQRAANQGYAPTQLDLGICYESGLGVRGT